jgi:hypothetical protein
VSNHFFILFPQSAEQAALFLGGDYQLLIFRLLTSQLMDGSALCYTSDSLSANPSTDERPRKKIRYDLSQAGVEQVTNKQVLMKPLKIRHCILYKIK